MLIQFTKETSGRATGDYHQPGRSHMRGDGGNISPRNSIQLRADAPRRLSAVAPSRSEENDGASFLSACRAALLDVAAVLAAVLLVSATGVGIAFAAFVLMFMSL